MKIVIAAWHLKNFNVGLGRYCRELIEAIGRIDQTNHYDVLMPDDSCRFPIRPTMRYHTVRIPIFKRRVWEQLSPWLAGRHDLIHFPYDSALAWKRSKFVTTVHDLKPMLFRELAARANVSSLIERAWVGDRWQTMDHVLTDSVCSKHDLMRLVGFPAERVTVVPPGVDLSRFRPAVERRIVHGARPYVLCVAGTDPTKNVETLVAAFARLPRSILDTHDLVLAGDVQKRQIVQSAVRRHDLEKQTVFTGVVPDERLIELYQQAALFVFPSLYEGFGLPVLEAMACGCPVICSFASSLPEVAGNAAILVDPEEANNLTEQMEHVLMDPAARRELQEKGLVQAAQFSWDRTARETVAVYERVVEGGRSISPRWVGGDQVVRCAQ
ncbi:MAG: glycosyltransferase family 4 protein [Nitrospiraceae bacterium]